MPTISLSPKLCNSRDILAERYKSLENQGTGPKGDRCVILKCEKWKQEE